MEVSNRNLYTGCFASLILCIFYICILDYYTFPSGDEIGTADSAINWVTNGEWYSAVWVYTYHPLHNFLLTIWISVFGVSHQAVCSMNVAIAFIVSLLCLKILSERKIINSLFSVLLFVFLFWAIAPHSNGRIDCLMLLFSLGIADQLIPSSENRKKNNKLLAFYSFGLMFTGIYSLPILLVLGIALLIYARKDVEKRNVLITQAKIIVLFCFISFVIICIFYLYNHRLLRFLQTYIRFNSNFNKGMDNLLVHYTFSQMVIDGYKNIYIDIFVLYGILIGYLKKEWNLLYVSVFVLSIPVLGSAAGHYVSYYYWMMNIFAIVILFWSMAILNNRYYNICISIIVIWLFASPLFSSFNTPTKKEKVSNIQAYLERNKEYLKDSVYVHFEAQQSAIFYYLLRDYPVKISGKVRILENYVDPKIVFEKTINKKTNDIELRKLAMNVFDMIESYKEPDLRKGIIIVNDKDKYQTLKEKLIEKGYKYKTISKYNDFVMVSFNY